ncbi:MAG: hypothetical protein WAT92_07520 [Saprospiraceae bacterium]|nr:hypothetical protein [Saprospiraceae bacterium]
MKSITFSLLLLFFSYTSFAQLCSGNLGSNIFDDGNFGIGKEAVVFTDPNIAPGYRYVTGVPNDGQYALAHNTTDLSGLYPTWLNIGDRTDKDGYIMVVNASFQPGIFYEKEIVGLCPNTLYEFSADVINLIKRDITMHIFPDVAFLLDGSVKYTTGPVLQTEQWIKAGFSFTTAMNQTSVKLTLRNNAAGGNGNDLALDNISFRACGPRSFVAIQAGQTIFKCKDSQPFKLTAEVGATNQYVIWQTSLDGFTWTNVTQGQVYEITHDRFTPGSYYYRYLTAGDEFNIQNEKCRVISDAVLVEVVKDVYEKYDTICLGNKYSFATNNLDAIGDYTHTFVSSLGCDSTVNLHLHVVNANNLQTNALFDEPKCFGTATGKIIDLQSSGGHPPYVTSVLIVQGNSENDLEKLKEGVYDISIKDRHGCFSKEQIVLTDPPLFEIKSLPDTVVELGESIKLTVSTNYNPKDIRWDSPDFSSKELEPIYIPTTSNILNLTAFNANDCRAGDTISITVNRDYRIYFPNILSFASKDGNDEFFFKSFNNIIQTIEVFEVYDRYGNIVERAESVNPDYIWQGKLSSKPILPGVYPFIVKLILINGEIINRSGTITIVD